MATVMARLDRGRYARRLSVWRQVFETYLEPLVIEPYGVAGLWAMVYFQGKAR